MQYSVENRRYKAIWQCIRTFILFVSYSMTRPLWYHVMLAAGLEPYEMQSRLLGSPERKGFSAPVIATLNGFTVKCFETKFNKILL